MGLPQPKFSPQEADSIHARFAKNGGQAIGIIIGLKKILFLIYILQIFKVVCWACFRYFLWIQANTCPEEKMKNPTTSKKKLSRNKKTFHFKISTIY